MKRLNNILVIMFAMLLLIACNKSTDNKNADNNGDDKMRLEDYSMISQDTRDSMIQLQEPEKGEEIALLNTNKGKIYIRLFPKEAPKTVENFVTHIKNGYYDGVTFHRVIDEFMIQGGDPDGTGMGGESIWGESFEDEFSPNLANIRGALSMANAGPNTNGSQFFIVQNTKLQDKLVSQIDQALTQGYPKNFAEAYKALGGTPFLDGRHTVFGQVISGMDVVDAIAKVEKDASDKPVEAVVIEKAEIIKY